MSEHEALGTERSLVGRAARIAAVLGKYGFRETAGRDGEPAAVRARRLRDALEELGPTFAKLGQILSTRPDLLPPEFVAELASLQDDVAPMTEAEVVSVMEEELGVPWEDVFDSIDAEPLAAGTIGQVHRARLESGDRVVVKVQRPTARDEILRDLSLLELFAEKTSNRAVFHRVIDLPAAIEHLSSSLRRELDFKQEAGNIERMRSVVASFSRIGAPAVYEQLTTSRLLVLEEIPGVPVRQAPQGPARREAARQLLEFYYRQILGDGFFHADPHPGNMLWSDEQIYFLDFGMVGELPAETRDLLLLLLLAFWLEDVPFLTEVVLMLADSAPDDLDMRALEQELAALLRRFRHASLGEIQLGPVLQELTQIATRHGVRLPASLALTGKALAQMQLTAAELDSQLDPFSAVGGFLVRNLLGRMRAGADPKRIFYESQKLRARGTRLVDAIERIAGARPGPKLQVDVRGIGPLERTIGAAARRLALAIIAGAVFIAAGSTATAERVSDWVPATLAGVGAFLTVVLLLDLLRSR
jgi:ubiquinone biosynthesis protein